MLSQYIIINQDKIELAERLKKMENDDLMPKLIEELKSQNQQERKRLKMVSQI